ncbi:MAG: GNAT family N-acetyltransferase [Pseudomonadota bacterium]|nr:GNAT family N-acetyltransferase [Pseudomonadota bacterium]
MRWRARPVVEHAQVAQCVALQAESLRNRGADPAGHLERLTRRLTAGAGSAADVLVTVEASGACQGFLWSSLRTLRGPRGDTLVCHLDSIVLTRAARGQGLGSELMSRFEQDAREAGFAAVSLNSMADNHRVAGFYERLGYELVGLDLEKALTHSGPPAPEPGLRRLPWGEPPERPDIDAAPLRDAFEPGPGGRPPLPTERFEQHGALLGLVGTAFRRATDGTPIVVFDPFFLTPVFLTPLGPSPASVRGIVADREHAAHESGAERAYVTIWEPRSPTARVLQDLGYQIGRHKWWKGLTKPRSAT